MNHPTQSTPPSPTGAAPAKATNFIRQIVEKDLASAKHKGRVATRFPPEPNGFLHIGHAKSICLNFGIAQDYKGVCHLRYDDTNPTKEEVRYVESIQEDVHWLGFDWGTHLYYASDYFEKIYQYAVQLIKDGKAYVCSLNEDQLRTHRGTLTQPGKDSPDRNRGVKENLELFEKMRAGAFPDGKYTLRAKIDMSSPNINMRDPTLYRIRKAHHHRTRDQWCIYPMYDFTHCLSDALEDITHSICTLEFEDHRPLYDWFLDILKTPSHPQQIEFARLNLDYTVMSKRRLLELVEEKIVNDWDDPRLPTIGGMRRRGYTPAAIRNFCERIGVTKKESRIELSLLENCVREDLDHHATRGMAVLNPLKVTLENYPEGKSETVESPNHPKRTELGTRPLPFSRNILIDQDDFQETPEPGFRRLSPGKSVRLRYAYVITCQKVIKNPKTGMPQELICTYDPATRNKDPEGQKIKGIVHWLSEPHSVPVEVRLYDRLFSKPDPSEGVQDYRENLNPKSLEVVTNARMEAPLKNVPPESRIQFERLGFFCSDRKDHAPQHPVFNRTVTLRETWNNGNTGNPTAKKP